MAKEKSVGDVIKEASALFTERDSVHGKNYIKMGGILKEYFPLGVSLSTKDDFVRFSLLVMVLGKMGRYAECFLRGETHDDSTKDAGVYAFMLNHYDKYEASEKLKNSRGKNGNKKA